MKRPTPDKFIYDLHCLPSCLQNYHSPSDARRYRLMHKKIMREHKKWMSRNTNPHHRCPPTKYPLTSGELSMLQLQKEELEPRRNKKNTQPDVRPLVES